ncbi:MAG: BamA/TamA family outer membrane protein, partial [Mariprofundaceae bacterium]
MLKRIVIGEAWQWPLLTAITFILALGMSAPCRAGEARIIEAPIAVPEAISKALRTPGLEKQGILGARLNHAADLDAGILGDWLRAEGYLDAEITIESVTQGEMRFRVIAGPLWRIAEVDITPPPPTGAKLPETGQIFRSETYEQAKAALRGSWADQGFLQAYFAEAQAIPDHVNKTVRIHWRLEPGPLFHVATIEVVGARQYDAELAKRLSLLTTGDVPTRTAIRDGIANIGRDARYKSAVILPRTGQADDGSVPVRIEVVEAARRVLTGEVGYSTDTGANIGASWTDRGLLNGKFAYGVHGLWSRDTSGAGITASRPSWPGLRDRVGLDLDYLRESTSGRDFDTFGGGPFWRRDFARFDFIKISLRQKWITEDHGSLRLIEPALALHLDRRLGGGLPHGGWRADVSVSLPWRTNGVGRWLTTRLNGRVYQRLGKWVLLVPRAGYGRSVALRETVPKAFRQFLGGAGSVRGYALDSLGPVGADGLASGGLSAGHAGFDMVFMPDKRFSPILFADVGKVWHAPAGREPAAISAGAGLVIGTPAGPVRVDIAIPLRRRSQDASFQFYFSLGEII